MNEKGSRTPEDTLRVALAPDETIAPLDPVRVIAGARRRRKVRAAMTAAIVVVAVAGVATGSMLAGSRSLGNGPAPASPAPVPSTAATIPSPNTPGPPVTIPSTQMTVRPTHTSNLPPSAAALTIADCRSGLVDRAGPGPNATLRTEGSDNVGSTVVIADSRYWMACNRTSTHQFAAREPKRLQRPSPQDTDAFAVANEVVERPEGLREFFWAAGMVPAGVARIQYTFPDGITEDAVLQGDFWLLRHLSDEPPPTAAPTTRIRIRLLSANGAVVNDFQLVWGVQTCAQITHGC